MDEVFEISSSLGTNCYPKDISNKTGPKGPIATYGSTLTELNNVKEPEPEKVEKVKKERVKLPRKKHEISPENKEKMLENLRKGREARKNSGLVKSAKSQDIIMKELTELKSLMTSQKQEPPKVEQPKPEPPKVVVKTEPPKVVPKPEPPKVVVSQPVNIPSPSGTNFPPGTKVEPPKQPTIYSTFKRPLW